MNATNVMSEAISTKRYNYFFNKKNISAPNPSVLCRSIIQQLQELEDVKNGRNYLVAELWQKDKDTNGDYLFDEMKLTFLFRESPIDEVENLVPIYFSLVFWCDGFGECYHGLSIWSDQNKDFYTFIVAGAAPAATKVLDYNFASHLSQLFHQKTDDKDNQ